MKKLLLSLVLMVSLFAHAQPAEITVPDSNLNYENNTVMYQGKPYTGRIIVKGSEGFINLKDGHLDGLTEMTSKPDFRFKVTVVNGRFDGDYITEGGSTKTHLVFAAGKLKSVKTEKPNEQEDMTVSDNGHYSGKVTVNGKALELKNGVAEINGQTIKIRMQDDGKMLTEIYQKNKLVKREENDMALIPATLEEKMFPVLFSAE